MIVVERRQVGPHRGPEVAAGASSAARPRWSPRPRRSLRSSRRRVVRRVVVARRIERRVTCLPSLLDVEHGAEGELLLLRVDRAGRLHVGDRVVADLAPTRPGCRRTSRAGLEARRRGDGDEQRSRSRRGRCSRRSGGGCGSTTRPERGDPAAAAERPLGRRPRARTRPPAQRARTNAKANRTSAERRSSGVGERRDRDGADARRPPAARGASRHSDPGADPAPGEQRADAGEQHQHDRQRRRVPVEPRRAQRRLLAR